MYAIHNGVTLVLQCLKTEHRIDRWLKNRDRDALSGGGDTDSGKRLAVLTSRPFVCWGRYGLGEETSCLDMFSVKKISHFLLNVISGKFFRQAESSHILCQNIREAMS